MAPRRVALASPAKLNLFLEVTGRRADGYHTLSTLFAKLDLHDDVAVAASHRPGARLTLKNETRTRLSAGPDNLAVRAARAYLDRFKVRGGADIRLTKRIPIGGGLGGGSSNAGTVLRALARLYPGPGRTEKTLVSIAKSLGADVPLFVLEGGVYAASGVGDRLRRVRLRKPLPPVVLVHPGVAVPTAAAYRGLGRAPLTGRRRIGKIIEAVSTGEPVPDSFNRLEQAVLPAFPRVAEAKRALVAMGAPALMTGSGSCVFAFTDGSAQGRRLARRLKRAGWDARLVRIVD